MSEPNRLQLKQAQRIAAESPHVFWRVTLIEVNRAKNVMPKVNGKNQTMMTEWFLDLFYHLFF